MKAKRIISSILATMISLTNISSCFSVHAAEKNVTASTIENNEISVNAENSLGSLFSNEIEEQIEQQNNTGNSIVSVEINDKTATVNYNCTVDCNVIVGVFDDSGTTLLGSGKTNASRNDRTVSVEVDINVLPEYFYLKAYLVDSLGLAPLSEVYENPNYTSKMKEFFSKTVDDFDEERVLVFDEKTTDNFAVFSKDVTLLDEVEGYNDVTLCDNENGIYIFENADETLMSLNSGDILSYDYGDESEIIIVKIDTIEINDTTVTITADETRLEEVFEYIRIDKQADQSEAQFNTEGIPDVIESDFSNLNHSDEHESSTENHAESIGDTTLQFNDNINVLSDDDIEVKSKLELDIENGKAEVSKTDSVKIVFASNEQSVVDKDSNLTLKADIFKGTILYTSTLSLKLYFSDESKLGEFDSEKHSELVKYFEIKWKIQLTIDGAMTVSARKDFPFGNVTYPIGLGFSINFKPKVIIGGEAEVNLNGVFSETLGFRVENGISKSISESPKFSPKIKAKGVFYIGIDVCPTIKWINKLLAYVEMELSGTAKITVNTEVELPGIGGDNKRKDKHQCTDGIFSKGCLDGRIDFIIKIGGTGKILNNDNLKISLDAEWSFHFNDFYYSAEFNEFEWGKCPHKLYYYELNVSDKNKKPVEGAAISCGNESFTTDADGNAIVYLSPDSNNVKVTKENYDDFKKNYIVKVLRKNANSSKASGSIEAKDDKFSVDGGLEFKFDTKEVVKINGDESRSAKIVLRDKAYDVNVTVVDQDGKPLKSAKVKSDCDDDYYVIKDTTLFDGKAKLTLPAGVWDISASLSGYSKATETIVIENNNVEIELVLAKNHCTFYVTDQNKEPVKGASILLRNTETNESIYKSSLSNDDNGVYECCLSTGDYEITVSKFGFNSYTGKLSVPDGGVYHEIELYCDYKDVTVTVIDINGEILGGAYVTNSFNGATYMTNYEEGKAVIQLPKGVYTVTAEGGVWEKGSAMVTVTDNAASNKVTIYMKEYIGGTYGENVFWHLHNGILDITGSGDTRDSYDFTPPWEYFSYDITRLNIANGITRIGYYAFGHLHNITSLLIPNSVTSIGEWAFDNCAGLKNISFGSNVEYIGSYAFASCHSLASVSIPEKVSSISGCAFAECSSLKSVYIGRNVTKIEHQAFFECFNLANVYYSGTKEEWNNIDIADENECLTNATIHFNYTPASTYSLSSIPEVLVMDDEPVDNESPIARKVTFKDLDPNRIYNFYSVKSREVEDTLSAENLVYVSQGTADEKGCLTFEYFPNAETEEAVEFVVGMINCIEYMDISIEDMEYTGNKLTAEITVANDGEILVEDTDYTLSGTLSTTQPGTYEVKVSGIGDYYGEKYVYYTVTCTHEYAEGICTICGTQCAHTYEDGICKVCGNTEHITSTTTSTTTSSTTTSTTTTMPPVIEDILYGDVDEDGKVAASDASLTLIEYANLSSGNSSFTEEQVKACDVNEDNKIGADDAANILMFYTYLSGGGTEKDMKKWFSMQN